MKVVNLSPAQFDDFSNKNPNKTYYQSSTYGDFIKHFSFKVEYLGIVDDNNDLLGASLIMYKEAFMGNKIGYAPRGFLFDYEDKKRTTQLVETLKRDLAKKKYMYLIMDPSVALSVRDKNGEIVSLNHNAESTLNNIKASGFTYKGETKYLENQSQKSRWEALVTLNEDIRDKFNKFDKRTRSKIRKASSAGLEIVKDDKKDIKYLYEFVKKKERKPLSYFQQFIKEFGDNVEVYYANVNTETYIINSRRAYEKEVETNDNLAEIIQDPSIDQKARDEYISKKMKSDAQKEVYKNNMIQSTKLLKEYPKGIPVAGAIVLKYDNAAFIITDGINEKYRNLYAGYFLKWKLIEEYMNEGIKYINLGPISGDFTPNNKYQALNESKLGFNTLVTENIGEFELIIKKLSYNLYLNLNKK